MFIGGLGSVGGRPFEGLRMDFRRAERTLNADLQTQRQLGTMRDLASALVGLRRTFEGFQTDAQVKRAAAGAGLQPPVQVGSAGDLGLRIDGQRTTLRSTEEVNATPTSYTPFEPSFQGLSSTTPSIGGVYNGDQGDDTLTFKVRRTRVVGESNVRLDIYDGNGDQIENVVIRASDPIGTEYTLSNGLTVALSDGVAVRDDTFQVGVSVSQGSAVDPNKAFDGTGNDQPNFELGRSVGAGSFKVNGTTIAVAANDSLQSVLDRINASSAGVTAVFDVATEKISLARNEDGPLDITLSDDSSGFLAATKLDSATPTLGRLPDLETRIADVPALAGIQSGTFAINGVELSVDVDLDTLAQVIDRINASEAGVDASYDETQGRLSIRNREAGESLVLDDGTSGFFTATQVAIGEFEAVVASRRRSSGPEFRRPQIVGRGLEEIAKSLGSLFETAFGGLASVEAARARSLITNAIQESFGELGDGAGDLLRSGLGIDFSKEGDTPRLEVDTVRLLRSARTQPAELHELLFSETRGHRGLVAAVGDVVDSLIEDLGQQLAGGSGLGLDLLV